MTGARLWGAARSDCAQVAPTTAQEAANARFHELCAPLRADLVRYILWLSRDRELAEDVVQETFRRAWTHIDSLHDERAARGWLIMIARRELARAYSRKRPVLISLESLGEEDVQVAFSSTSDEHDELRGAVMALPDRYREMLVLQVLFGYTTNEIAKMLGSTHDAVCSRLFRARKKLLALLSSDGIKRDDWSLQTVG